MLRHALQLRSTSAFWITALFAILTVGSAHGDELPPPIETNPLDALTGMGDDTTAHKPQSKLWKHDDTWWSALSDGDETWLWELSGTHWNPVLEIDSADEMHADCRRVGNLVHILLQDDANVRLVSLEYVGGSYQLWSARPTATTLTLGSSVEVATLDIDSSGRIWVAYDTSNEVQVRYSDSPYTSFSAPITLETGITNDDISLVTTLNDGSIGVLWSNQNAERFGFRRHLDGSAATSWTANEVPASQSAQAVGDGMADDHLNVAIASDGTLYAAVKTSYDQPGYPKTAILIRRPSGSWDDLYEVDTDGTRPIVVLDEAAGRLRVVYTLNEGSKPIVQKIASTSDLVFCEREILINIVLINATSTKETVAGDEVILASRNTTVQGIHIVSEPDDPPPAPGLVGLWRLDEGSGNLIVDDSPLGNHGSIHGNATWVEGIDNLALDVDGYCTVPDHASLDLTDQITLAAWLRPDVVTTQYVIKKATSGQDGYELSLSSGGYPFVRFNQSTSGNTYRVDANSDYPVNGVDWMHLAATYDGDTIRLYVNGVEEASLNADFDISTNALALGLGAQGDGVRPFQGAMDDLRLYSQTLSAVEIADLVDDVATTPPFATPSSEPQLILTGPNPFQDTATLRIALDPTQSHADHLAIVIFDALGRQVERLHMTPGAGEVTWKAVRSDGRRMPAGVYLARLEVGGMILPQKAQRLILLR